MPNTARRLDNSMFQTLSSASSRQGVTCGSKIQCAGYCGRSGDSRDGTRQNLDEMVETSEGYGGGGGGEASAVTLSYGTAAAVGHGGVGLGFQSVRAERRGCEIGRAHV